MQVGTANDWKTVDLRTAHSFAIKKNGTLWAWGSNSFGQTANVYSTSPTQVGTDNNWAAVSTGSLHTLALKTDGTLWATGRNFYGELGNGTNNNSSSFIQIGTATDWAFI